MVSQDIPQIDVTTLDEMRRGGREVVVLDVREDWERQICRVDPSIDVPMAAVPQAVDDLPRDRPLVVMCHHGVRSLQAAMWLRTRGFDNVVNLAGGIDAWRREIDPTMEGY